VEETFLSAAECTGIKDVRHTEIQTAEPLVPKSRAFEIELAVERRSWEFDINSEL
jgi:hypothetical protein